MRLAERWFTQSQQFGGAEGDTLSDHEQRLRWQASGGKLPKRPRRQKRAPKPPNHPLWYLVEWYQQIRAGIPGEMNYRPIPPSEIVALRDLYRFDLDAFDADTLRRLDTLWLKCRPKRDTESRR